MKKFILLASVLISLALFGCSEEKQETWASLTITNSNGKVTNVTCPGTEGCDKLEKSLDGEFYKETERYSQNPELKTGSIDLTDPEFKPKKLPGTIKTKMGPPNLNKNPYRKGEACFIITYGEESIRVKGTINGREVDFKRNQTDDCQADEYGLWDEFFGIE